MTHAPATTWAEARRIAGDVAALPIVRLELQQAMGLVLAEDLVAPCPVPVTDTAAMGGFAVAGVGPWRRVGALLAGQVRIVSLEAGECVEIATGAAVPAGTDAVLCYEDVTGCANGSVRGAVAVGRHIRRAGSDIPPGATVLDRGTRLSAAALGLAASVGHDQVPVHRRPRVAVTVTGAEIRTSGRPEPGAVRDALGPAVGGLVAGFGGEVSAIEHVADDEAALLRFLQRSDADVHVVTGGSSIGPADRLHKVLAELGATLLVDGVACRPGHPQVLAALSDGRRVVGLPGNPFAAVAGAVTLLRPLLAARAGLVLADDVIARLDVEPRDGATLLVPVRPGPDGRWDVLPATSSASLLSLAVASHLAAIERGCEAVLLPLPTGIAS